MSNQSTDVAVIRGQIIGEIMVALGLPKNGWGRKLLTPVFWLPSDRFARLVSDIEYQIETNGSVETARWILPRFVENVEVRGADQIPVEGPLLIVSNHPGAYDLPVIAATLPRTDAKAIVSNIAFLLDLPNLGPFFIPVTKEPHKGMAGVRQAIRHLKNGGALQIFPSGIVDPDPELLPGAYEALEKWSPSIELMLRRVPECQVAVTIVSGVLSPAWLNSPITKVQKEIWRRRKLAEFFQIMQQMIFPGRMRLSPRISFAPPVTAAELKAEAALASEPTTVHQQLIKRAQALLGEHMQPVQDAEWLFAE